MDVAGTKESCASTVVLCMEWTLFELPNHIKFDVFCYSPENILPYTEKHVNYLPFIHCM